MSIQLTVIGLNRVGVSIGLALKDNPAQISRIGSDANVGNEQQALKMGAFDKIVHNIPSAIEDADIVVLCVPMDELRKNLEIIAPILKPGAVTLDTSPLAVAVSAWVKDLFPEERYLVSFTPSLNPDHIAGMEDTISQARADLFKNSLISISAPPSTHPGAIQLAGDLANLLGAKPYFSDAYESDGLIALVEMLPTLSAVALLQAATKQPGWREARKLAGHAFFTASEPVDHLDGLKEPGAATLLNAENLVRVITDLINELQSLQELIKNQDSDELNRALANAVAARKQWWQNRQKSDWGAVTDTAPMPTRGQMLSGLLGLGHLKESRSNKK